MTAYIMRELARDAVEGYRYSELTADGEVVLSRALASDIRRLLRRLMQPGDTCQEYYSSGRRSKMASYEDMQEDWRRDDAFDTKGAKR